MKIDSDRFVEIQKICDSLDPEVCDVFPSYSMTGCETTSFPYGVEKVKPLQNALKSGKWRHLQEFAENLTQYEDMDSAKMVMHPGRENETPVETSIKMYENQKQ